MSISALRSHFREDKISLFIIGIAGAALIWFTFSRTRVPLSRIITVERLVEAGTFAHSSPEGKSPFPLSIDHVKVKDRVYSSKPPSYPMLMAGEAKLMKMVTGWNFYKRHADYIHVLVLLNQVLPYLLMLVLAFSMMVELKMKPWTRHFLLLAMSLGMLPFGYAVTLNNHTLSAVLLFISFYLVWRITRQDKGGAFHYFLVGILSGFAVANDLTAGMFMIFLWSLLFFKNWKLSGLTLLAMAIPFLVSALVFYQSSGSIKPFYLQGGLYRYGESYWTSPQGWDAAHDSTGIYLLNITFGHHGLFSISPVLLLCLGALPLWVKNKGFQLKKEFILIWAFVISLFLYVIFRTHNYGGDCIGLRWFIAFMPLLMFTAWPLVERAAESLAGKLACILLLLLSLPAVAESLYWDGYIRGSFEHLWMKYIGI